MIPWPLIVKRSDTTKHAVHISNAVAKACHINYTTVQYVDFE